MEIRLNCFDTIELNGFKKLEMIQLNVLSYNLKDDTLKGDVKINGEYLKGDETTGKNFEDLIPFTIVFRSSNISIDKVSIENENYTLEENMGVKLNFEIVVNYTLVEEKENKQNDEVIEVPVEIYSENIVSSELVEDAEEVTLQYEKILDEVMNVREAIEEENNCYINEVHDDSVNFINQNTTYKTISVYYLDKESEIENISKERRISVQELYKNNDDFNQTRRIIVNE